MAPTESPQDVSRTSAGWTVPERITCAPPYAACPRLADGPTTVQVSPVPVRILRIVASSPYTVGLLGSGNIRRGRQRPPDPDSLARTGPAQYRRDSPRGRRVACPACPATVT